MLCFTVNTAFGSDVFNSEGRFTATLPTGWIEIPKSVLEDHVRSLERNMPQMAGQLTEFSFGYQIKDAAWFSYPYCFGYINRNGRGKESELIKWTKNDFRDVFEQG